MIDLMLFSILIDLSNNSLSWSSHKLQYFYIHRGSTLISTVSNTTLEWHPPPHLSKPKAVSLHWEYMFARPVFGTLDMAAQGAILDEVARLVDAGKIRSTATEVAGKIDAATLRRAHAQIESGSTRGKIVLEGCRQTLCEPTTMQ